MKILSIRLCVVSAEVDALVRFFDQLGAPRKPLPPEIADSFPGAIFLAGESWIEVWKDGPQMPAGTMLQIVVDDADAFAAHARGNGLSVEGPMDAHGERIYFARAPGGMQLSFQSALG